MRPRKRFKEAASAMKAVPIQLDNHKCSFGHFYYSVEITNPIILSVWNEIGELHHDFHQCGSRVLEEIKKNHESEAKKLLEEISELSKSMFQKIDAILESVHDEMRI